MRHNFHHRAISLLLALALLLSMMPQMLLFTVEAVEEDYSQYIGWYAALNAADEESSFLVLDYEPDETYNEGSMVFHVSEFSDDVRFRVTAYKIVTEAYESFDEDGEVVTVSRQSLWYQVNVVGGTAPEDLADGCWILQNYLNAEDAYENDVLTLTEPEETSLTDEDTGVTVTGELPAGATVEVTLPEIDGEPIPGLYDIKVYLADGVTEWQPIDEGKTVTVSIPVEGVEDGEYVDVYHFIDYAADIDGDEEIISTEGVDSDMLIPFQPALDAYGDGIHVAMEVAENVIASNGVANIETDSFSLYTPDYEVVTDGDYMITFTSTTGVPDVANEHTYYAPIGQVIKFKTEWNQGTDWSITTLVGNATETIDDITESKWYEFDNQYTSCTVTFDAEGIMPGDTFQIDWSTDQWGGKQPRWTRVMIVGEYPITFNANGGTFADGEATHEQTIISYQPVSVVEEPTRDGYVFTGWSVTADGTGTTYTPTDNFPAVIATGTVFYAQWEPVEYTITYVVPDTATNKDLFTEQGGAYGQVLALHGETPVIDDDTIFQYWQGSDGNTYMPGSTYTVIEDLTLTAVWNKAVWSVTYDANGGTGAPATQYRDTSDPNVGTGITLSSTVPTRTGYVFNGWNTKKDGTGTAYTSGQTIDPFEINLILYAQWKDDTYTIAFDANGGSGSMTEMSSLAYNSYANLTANSFTNAPQTFQGWALTRDAIGVLYTNGQNVKVSDLVAAAAQSGQTGNTITLYAVWATETFTITYDPNGGSAGALSQTVIATDGTATATINNSCGLSGHTFMGWEKPDGTVVQNGETITLTADITLTAVWNLNVVGYIGTMDSNNNLTMMGTITDANGGVHQGKYLQAIEAGGSITGMTFTPPEGYEIVQIWVKAAQQTVTDTTSYTYPAESDIKDPFNVVVIVAPKTITITFVDTDGTTLHTITQDYGTAVTAPANPTKNGYTFAGWDKTVPTTMPAENVTITAQWTINSYTVTFKDWNGTTLKTQTVEHGGAATAPADPTRTGHTFTGWDVEFDDVTSDLTVTAQYSVSSYMITYVLGNGQENIVQTYAYGAAVTSPADPTKTGYTFAGWDKTVPTTMPAENVTITAQWTINKYVIKFINEDGSVLQSSEWEYGTTPTYTGATPTKAATAQYTYTFAGWTPAISTVTGEATYTATYSSTVNQYTVTIECDGAMVEVTGSGTYDYGATANISFTPKEGYEITDITLNGTSWGTLNPSGGSNNLVVDKNYTIVVTAKLKTYTVQFDTTISVTNEDKLRMDPVDHGNTIVLPEPIPADSGYAFQGWEDKNGKLYQANASVEITSDMVFKAVWEPQPYEITYVFVFTNNANVTTPTLLTDGGKYTTVVALEEIATRPVIAGYHWVSTTAAGETSKQSYTIDNNTITMPAENVVVTLTYAPNTDTGYTVKHYQEKLDGTYELVEKQELTGTTDSTVTPDVKDYDGFTAPSTQTVTIAADGSTEVNYYYTRNSYTITFDTNGGSAVAAITQPYGAAVTSPADPTREGYTFDGWDTEIPATMPAGDMTITAKWKINQYTITFDTDGGSAVAAITQDYGTAVTAPANPTKEGYTFAGWDKTIPATMPAGDMTITAKWKINQYTITFDTNGGSAVAAITQDYGTAVTAPADPTKTGYTFDGWYANAELTQKYTFSTMPAENITLYAKWTEVLGELTIVKHVHNIGKNDLTIAQTFTFVITLPSDKSIEEYRAALESQGITVIDVGTNSFKVTIVVTDTIAGGTADNPGTLPNKRPIELVITGLPLGAYKIVEEPKEGFEANFDAEDSNKHEGNVTLTESAPKNQVVIYNTYPVYVGDLTITKVVEKEFAGDKVPEDAEFTFTVTLTPHSYALDLLREYDYSYTITDKAGNQTTKSATLVFGEDETSKELQVKLKDGETVTFKDLPTGSYSIQETVPTGYTHTAPENASGTIYSDSEPDKTPIVTFVNKLDRTTGSLTITKTVSNIGTVDVEASDKVFTFRVELPENVTKDDFGNHDGIVWAADGKSFTVTITISDVVPAGETVEGKLTFTNVPSGDYRVYETAVSVEGFVVIVSPVTAEVRSGAEGNAEFTNEYPVYLITYQVVGGEGGKVTAGTETGTAVTEKVRPETASSSATAEADAGYKFVGWYSDAACQTLVDTNATLTVTPKDGKWSENVIYYAKFEPVGSLTITKTVDNKDDAELTNQSFTFEVTMPDGKVFENYYVAPNTLPDGVSIATGTANDDKFIVTVTFASIAKNAASSLSVTIGNLPLGSYGVKEISIAEGFVSNWTDDETTLTLSGENTSVIAACTNEYPVYKVEYIVVAPNQNAGKVTADGVTGQSVAELYNFKTGEPVGATAGLLNANAYEFVGWYADESCEGDPISKELNYKPAKAEKDQVFYAKFAEKKVSITYVAVGPDGAANFGSVSPASQTIGVVTGAPSATATAASNAYKFIGWYDAAGNLLSQNATYAPEKNASGLYESATYYARFGYNLTSLTIRNNTVDEDGNAADYSAIDENQAFLFRIVGEQDGVDLTVTVQGNGQVKIEGLTVGYRYTVTLLTDWSWRYGDSPDHSYVVDGQSLVSGNGAAISFTLGVDGTVTFTSTRTEDRWLDGNGWLDKWFGNTENP